MKRQNHQLLSSSIFFSRLKGCKPLIRLVKIVSVQQYSAKKCWFGISCQKFWFWKKLSYKPLCFSGSSGHEHHQRHKATGVFQPRLSTNLSRRLLHSPSTRTSRFWDFPTNDIPGWWTLKTLGFLNSRYITALSGALGSFGFQDAANRLPDG